MEEDQNSVENEVTPQDQNSEAVETEQPKVEEKPIQESHGLEDEQERNWRELRRKKREAEIKAKAQEELIEKLLKSQKTESKVEEPDEFANIAPDDYPTWMQTDKRIERKAAEIAEKKIQEHEFKNEQLNYRKKLKKKFSDYDDVVNPESIAYLEENEPELALAYSKLGDKYAIGLSTYRYLKSLNLSEDLDKKRHANEVEKKIEKNQKTIQSPQVFDKRPMAQAFRSTEADRSKLYEEMMGYASQAGYGY